MTETHLPATWLDIHEKPEIWVTGADPTGVSDSTDAFVVAADAAVAAGLDYVRVSPGRYHCPGMTSNDMSGVYIIGDASMTPVTYVWPFASRAEITAAKPEIHGRGMIAIELDDGWDDHWEYVFPATKELGIPIGYAIAWERPQPWAKEVHRHGSEVVAHGDANMTTLTEAEQETACQAAISMVSAATGRDDNIAWVYPQHGRTVATDEICRKYFIRVRGDAGIDIRSKNQSMPWRCRAAALSSNDEDGWNEWKDVVDAVAVSNGKCLFYFHWVSAWGTLDLFIDFVRYCQEKGVAIVRPSDVASDANLLPRSRGDIGVTAVTGAVTEVSSPTWDGRDSIEINNDSGAYSTYKLRTAVVQNPYTTGYTRVLFSFRYHANSTILFSPVHLYYSGLNVGFGGFGWNDGITGTYGGYSLPAELVPNFLYSDELPAGEWVRHTEMVLVPAKYRQMYFDVNVQRMTTGQTFHLADFRIELLENLPKVTERITLNGTTPVPASGDLSRIMPFYDFPTFALSANTAMSGIARVQHSTHSVNKNAVSVLSSDASDTNEIVISACPGNNHKI